MGSSLARIEANKRNAKLSTGPRSASGKARSAGNATKHGLLARHAVMASEDPAEFEAFANDAFATLAPKGPLETLHASNAIACAWRLRRAYGIESAMLERGSQRRSVSPDLDALLGEPAESERSRLAMYTDKLESLTRYAAAIERSMHRSLSALRNLQIARNEKDGVSHGTPQAG